jgi:ornithine racemase
MKKEYPCMEINLGKIKHNAKQIVSLCGSREVHVVGVSKVFCARRPIVKALLEGGIEIIGDSRLENLKKISELSCRKMLLRIPMGSHVADVVRYSDISLNSELCTIKRLSEAAKAINRIHSIILMIDVGDLREGILENEALDMVRNIIELDNINLCGLGTNLTCYGGVIPDENNLGRLVALKRSIKNEFGINLPLISGGNSSSLYMVMNGTMPEEVNQLRIGEAISLGRETSFGGIIPGCHEDCFTLKGEIVEIKYKPSVPMGNIGMDAFGEKPTFEDRGIIKRAIVALGRQDVTVTGLKPTDEDVEILGGSSDHLILDVTSCSRKLQVGDIIDFNVDYSCLLMSMTSPYVKKYYVD